MLGHLNYVIFHSIYLRDPYGHRVELAADTGTAGEMVKTAATTGTTEVLAETAATSASATCLAVAHSPGLTFTRRVR